jgi:hypothetical protein
MVAPTATSEEAWKNNSVEVGRGERNPKSDDLGGTAAPSGANSIVPP